MDALTDRQRDMLAVIGKTFTACTVVPDFRRLHPDVTEAQLQVLWQWVSEHELADCPLTSAVRLTAKGRDWLLGDPCRD